MKKTLFSYGKISLKTGGGFCLLSLLALFFLSSCRSAPDPMEPYRDLGAPKGVARDSYGEMMRKHEAEKKNGKKKSFFGSLFESDREKEKKFRDVSKPMETGTVQVFPWRSEERRSSALHEEIKKENKRSEALYW